MIKEWLGAIINKDIDQLKKEIEILGKQETKRVASEGTKILERADRAAYWRMFPHVTRNQEDIADLKQTINTLNGYLHSEEFLTSIVSRIKKMQLNIKE